MSRKKKDAGLGRETGHPRWIPFALFLFAFILRLLFWQATADRAWPHSAAYQGDAFLWLDYASSLRGGMPFEQGLPLRPPGNAYLMALLWDGTTAGFGWVKLCWCFFGALTVPLLFRAGRDAFSFPVGLATGLIAAAASPLLIFSTSLNNETPYLLLVAILLASWRNTSLSPNPRRLIVWGLVNALACLFRAEHLLFFVLATAAMFFFSRRHDRVGTTGKVLAKRLAWIFGSAFVCLLPWHLTAWQACRDFNRLEPQVPPNTEVALAAVERQLAYLSWDEEAAGRRDSLPAFLRRTAANFVAATVAYRGGNRVKADDFAILEEAFGSQPEAISEHPLLVLYGGLNFFLANPGDGTGGFSRVALEAGPPLRGGFDQYPPFLVDGLPPGDLALSYPPHLKAVNHGYGLGFSWLAAHPGEVPTLLFRKAEIFWSGAAPGLGGFNLPLGLSGLRRRVDLVVATGPLATAWQLCVLALFLLGLWSSRRRLEAWPFLALLLTQGVASLAFFGYARLGALTLPAIAAFAAAGAAALPWHKIPALAKAPTQRQVLRVAMAAAAVLLVSELIRAAQSPMAYLDDQITAQGDPWPPDQHENRRLDLRLR